MQDVEAHRHRSDMPRREWDFKVSYSTKRLFISTKPTHIGIMIEYFNLCDKISNKTSTISEVKFGVLKERGTLKWVVEENLIVCWGDVRSLWVSCFRLRHLSLKKDKMLWAIFFAVGLWKSLDFLLKKDGRESCERSVI